MKFANVIVDISHEKLDRPFGYIIPDELEKEITVGTAVTIPFGKGNRQIKGYVIEITDQPSFDISKMKEIMAVEEGAAKVESQLINLAYWIKENYGSTMNQALKTVIPVKNKIRNIEKKTIVLNLNSEQLEEKIKQYKRKNAKARLRLLEELKINNRMARELVVDKLNVSPSTLKSMEQLGDIVIEKTINYRNPIELKEQPEYDIVLNENQRKVSEAIKETMDFKKKDKVNVHLIHGITGSGKTEVYMEMIQSVVDKGKQAIVLIPEIALTYQTVMRFYRCFGDRVSIMNSRLSAGERYDQMMRAKRGEVDVMIGPRSALFTPFPDLGLIVIDEEHEPTYKSEQVPRYHAREVAVHRAEVEDASVVLGSATPSMEAMYRARLGEYQLYEMKNRSHMQQMATVYTVDMREELKNGNRSILSEKLQELIEDRLNAKEQIMLFLNRRGYSGFVSCRECGHVVKCPHCNVSLSVHKGGKMVCHYCGYEQPKVTECPECGSRYIGEFRAGTQQIEDMVKARFPQARVLRMDMDTTKKKDSHEQILSAFANEEADILVGTQMIVKGHDFPKVTLVGALAADMSLYTDDYRSGERTFQLLTQAAGRAGRGDRPGEVVIQTYDPEHYAIEASASQDYEAFYEKEIRYRSLMGYPPVENLMAVLAACEDEALLEKACKYLKEYILRIKGQAQLNVIGPASPGVDKIKDIYRRVIYVKAPEYRTLVVLKDRMEQYIEINSGFQKMRIQFDFNPMNL